MPQTDTFYILYLIMSCSVCVKDAKYIPILSVRESSSASPLTALFECNLATCNANYSQIGYLKDSSACCGSTENGTGQVSVVRVSILNSYGHVLWGATMNVHKGEWTDVESLAITSQNRQSSRITIFSYMPSEKFIFYGNSELSYVIFNVISTDNSNLYMLSRDLQGTFYNTTDLSNFSENNYQPVLANFTLTFIHETIEILPWNVDATVLPLLVGGVRIEVLAGLFTTFNFDKPWTLTYNMYSCGTDFDNLYFEHNYTMSLSPIYVSNNTIYIDMDAISASCIYLYPSCNSIANAMVLNVNILGPKGDEDFVRASQLVMDEYWEMESSVDSLTSNVEEFTSTTLELNSSINVEMILESTSSWITISQTVVSSEHRETTTFTEQLNSIGIVSIESSERPTSTSSRYYDHSSEEVEDNFSYSIIPGFIKNTNVSDSSSEDSTVVGSITSSELTAALQNEQDIYHSNHNKETEESNSNESKDDSEDNDAFNRTTSLRNDLESSSLSIVIPTTEDVGSKTESIWETNTNTYATELHQSNASGQNLFGNKASETPMICFAASDVVPFVRLVESLELHLKCQCFPLNTSETSEETMDEKVKKLVQHLVVDHTTLSSATRRKTSAWDSRPSAKFMGSVGISALVACGVFILALDIPYILDLFNKLRKWLKHRHR